MGSGVGSLVGSAEGGVVGIDVGCSVGSRVGSGVGCAVGSDDGCAVGSGVGILKWYIRTLLTLTRGHSTTVRDVTGSPCTRSTWSLCSLYSLDALTLTPSSCSMGTGRHTVV